MWLTTLVLFAPIPLAAQFRTPVEREVKAAYLYQFGRYVEWPSEDATAGSPFLICVLGEDPFGIVLDDTVKGKTIAGRGIAIRRVPAVTAMPDCRVLFVSRSEDDRLPAILKTLEGKLVLTVGDGTQFTRRGGMIGFAPEGNRIRFAVNLAAVEAGQLKLSSQLLRVAVNVEQ